MFVLLLILNLSPLFLCGESGERDEGRKKSKGKTDDDDDGSDGDDDDNGEEGGPIIKQNHPRHCRY